MTCVLPVHGGDIFLLFNLLRWIKQLGGCPGHSALIVADADLSWPQAKTAVALAGESFDHTEFITNGQAVTGWIAGSNSLWLTAAKHCSTQNIDGWLWLEPDAVPLRAGWLDALEKAYAGTVSDFLACRYSCNRVDCPATMMSGIAVYPDTAFAFFKPVAETFDIQLSRTAIDFVEHTPLIQQVWGQQGLPPTFRFTKTGTPRHAFTLAKFDPEAVLFHRNKDGTLIELLRDQAGLSAPPPLLVVLPVCVKDADLMLKCLDWMVELDGQNQFDCLLSHDPSLGPAWMSRLRAAAQRAFRHVHEFVYPRPVRENWPDAANIAFQSTALHIQAACHQPWFWFEADCVPLQPNWLSSLWLEYRNCGHPIMGPVVPGMGHMNGTAIYPANFANSAPHAMAAGYGTAFDSDMTPDLVGRTHDCSRSFCARWGMVNGTLHPSAGPAPHFSSPQSLAQWVPPGAVLFHRCKDGSLIDQLRAKKRALNNV
jgi:hypothetical protein